MTREELIEAMARGIDQIQDDEPPPSRPAMLRADRALSAIEALGYVVMPKADIVTIEKAAKSIYTQRNGHGCTPWHNINSQHREPYRKDARAVLAVLEDGKI